MGTQKALETTISEALSHIFATSTLLMRKTMKKEYFDAIPCVIKPGTTDTKHIYKTIMIYIKMYGNIY